VLSLLPDFFNPFANTLHYVMRENGPLPQIWRHYLAILASCRYRCDSLIALHRSEFLLAGGDPAWLDHVTNAPVKIQNVLELNALLAHQPWMITKDMIQRLVKGGSDAWSVAELVHAIAVLSTFHSLACVCHGVGITTEDDLVWTPEASAFSGSGVGYMTAGSTQLQQHRPSPSVTSSSPRGASQDNTQRLAQLLSSDLESLVADVTEQQVDSEVDPASIPIRIAPAGLSIATSAIPSSSSSAAASSDSPSAGSASSSSSSATPLSAVDALLPSAVVCPTAAPLPSVHPFLGGANPSSRISYEDFDLKRFTPFREQDYSWKEHGYALVNRFYEGFGPLLDTELDLIYAYTENNLGSGPEQLEHVDTGPFRRAVWYDTSHDTKISQR
jgi:sestrin